MPDGNALSSLYPQPPAPSSGLLSGDPSKVIGLAQGVNALSLFPLQRQQLQTQIQGSQIQNATALFEQRAKQNQFILDGLGTLADKDTVTMEDVHNFLPVLARNTGIPINILTGWERSLPNNPTQLKQSLVTLRNMARGSQAISTPEVTGYTPGGAPVVGTAGQAAYQRAGAGTNVPAAAGPPGVAGLPPGFEPRATGAAALDTKLAGDLANEAEGSPQRRGLLGNIMNLSDKFVPGPGAKESKEFKAFVNRNIPLPEGWKFDQKSIADQEEFAKQAAMFAQKQFDTIGGTGTDAKFSSAFTVSPNEALSRLGIKGISRLLLGNEDAIQAKNKAWIKASAADRNLSYREWSADFNSHFDPRTFQFKYLSKSERQQYIDSMPPEDRPAFYAALIHGHKQGWLNY